MAVLLSVVCRLPDRVFTRFTSADLNIIDIVRGVHMILLGGGGRALCSGPVECGLQVPR